MTDNIDDYGVSMRQQQQRRGMISNNKTKISNAHLFGTLSLPFPPTLALSKPVLFWRPTPIFPTVLFTKYGWKHLHTTIQKSNQQPTDNVASSLSSSKQVCVECRCVYGKGVDEHSPFPRMRISSILLFRCMWLYLILSFWYK